MKKCKLDAARLWQEIEEHLAPAYSLWASDRVVAFYLLRVSRLAGQRVVWMPARRLSRVTLLSRSTVRVALRRLAARGIVRILSRTYRGLRLEVKLPRELPGCVSETRLADGRNLDSLDFWSSRLRRRVIHQRDGNRCFYCLCRLTATNRVLDHVVPRRRSGQNSYRNLVACCEGCNMAKRDGRAAAHLRAVYREGRITAREFAGRLRALRLLQQGKLRPRL